MEENKGDQAIGQSINKGLVLSVVGWLLSTITLPLIANIVFGIMEGTEIDFLSIFDAGGTFLLIFGGLMLIIWIPAAFIAARAFRKKGFRQALIFTAAAYVISMIVFFGCTGSLRGI